MKEVLVVGAGFAGAAAATALAESGIRVILLEAHGHAGGRVASSAPSDMFPAPFDNSPHLFMGCYHETLRLFKRLGASKDLRWHDPMALAWILPGGRHVSLSTWPLPAPLHVAAGFLFSDAFPGHEKRSLSDAMRVLTLPDLAQEIREITVAAFLDRTGQGPAARERFWIPLTRSIVNLDPESAPLSLLASALRRVFSSRRFDSAFGLARYPLGDVLFPRLGPWLASHGGRLLLHHPARNLKCREGRFVTVDDAGMEYTTDAVIWAVPPWFLSAHLGDHAPAAGGEPSHFGKSAIVSVNVLLDREVLSGPFTGLSGARFDWAFNRNENWGWRSPAGRGQYLSFVASAAQDLATRGDGEIISLAVEELRERLPARAASFQVRHSKVVREMAATPKLDLASLRHRSPLKTSIPGLFLAGDWTDTRLPATVESAVLSGHRAAHAVLDFTLPARSG